MRKWTLSLLVFAATTLWMGPLRASSHREAPLISQDPLADNTDVYAFVSPSNPDRVTLIANFIPFEAPYGGPNFFKFDDNVLYEIKVDNNGDAVEDVTFQFRFKHRRSATRTRSSTTPARSRRSTRRTSTCASSTRVTRVDGPRRQRPRDGARRRTCRRRR